MMAKKSSDTIKKMVAQYFADLYRPGEGRISAVVSATENPRNGIVAFSGPVYEAHGGFPISRIGFVEKGGTLRMLSNDTFSDADPQWAPNGSRLAFLSDRGRVSGNFQLFVSVTDRVAEPIAGPIFDGEVVEDFEWSRDGKSILILTADAGADAAGSAATARVGARDSTERESWMPDVETGSYDGMWRRARIWRIDEDVVVKLGTDGQNIWEATWCGENEIAAIMSSRPTEGGWYDSEIGIGPVTGGPFARIAMPDLELAQISASPDGKHIAIIQGRFHRTVALGSLVIFSRDTGQVHTPKIDTEVSSVCWLSNDQVFFAGMRMPETVIGTFNRLTEKTSIIWSSTGTAGRKVPAAWPGINGNFLIPAHSFDTYAKLLRMDHEGGKETIIDLAHDGSRALLNDIAPAKSVWWRGVDGLDIQGFLVLPKNVKKAPLVTFIHGGPSHLFRDSWTFDNPLAACLVRAGYAVLFPNPRGSSGRGLSFASHVIGDWGGLDHKDILAGVDYVTSNYDVDGKKLFVLGSSYGGYMTSWLVTQTNCFTAACAMAPLTDMRSFYFTAHHPEFLPIYTHGDPYEIDGAFDQRSPLRYANKTATPTLLIAGGQDNTTPASQAYQFHRALVLNDIPSELATYPEEGHAAARLEAQMDQAIRVLKWFQRWEGRHGENA
ncbi:S9 family peptidase [Hyphococcus lacteus]|uniref:S9 family peptidase n=1 Tax=Hyphococcus lacteus TaxID=3143536 RepID=A0ABV3YZG2_9PROT